MAIKNIKRCSKSLAIRKMQIKAMSCYFISSNIAVIKTMVNNKGMEKLKSSSTAGDIVKYHSYFGKQFCSSSKFKQNSHVL
jgi:hypothetical protein